MNEVTIWGIYAGRAGDADTFFLKKNVVALRWDKLGDRSKLMADRDAFKAALAKAYPDDKAGAIPVNAGQLFRYIHELKVGDIVVYPSNETARFTSGVSRAAIHTTHPFMKGIHICGPSNGSNCFLVLTSHKVRSMRLVQP